MARIRRSEFAFDAITLEGSLISPAKLAAVAERKATKQTDADYHIPKGLTLRDETARYFRIGQALFRELFAGAHPSQQSTVRFTHELLRDVFGFADIEAVTEPRVRGDRTYIVSLEALKGRVPAVVVPPADDLDHASTHLSHDRRRSAASSLQDWLNAEDNALWALCCNGERLRLLRDNQSLTRPAYLEANLRQIFESEDFAGFAALWLIVHATRFGQPGSPPTDCAIEHWRESGSKEGLAARERLSIGVKEALLALGNGFLSHPANSNLRDRLTGGRLPLPDFFTELLRLVYRLIFLLAAEDRGLLHPPDAPDHARKLYAEGYSLGALRDRAIRRSGWNQFHDRWEGLLIVFRALAQGEPRLGLPALGGLFEHGATPSLDSVHLSNRALMEAIFRLAWLRDDSTIVPVNWRDMETEELGSVYEGLLELTPRLTQDGRGFAFAEGVETKGNERKKTGSYYTPDSLVQALLDSALDPVLDRVESEAQDASAALLGVTVIDPACGSGHFLLAAARRIATRIARARTGGVPSTADYRHALRDVVRCCVHGVDRNPMAIELARVALWIETVEPGRPLGFLDASLRVGDSLLGIFSLDALDKGIPDAAYKALTGDDRIVAKDLEKRNKRFRDIPAAPLDFSGSGAKPLPILANSFRRVRSLPEDTVQDVESKRGHYRAVHLAPDLTRLERAANVYIAAFLAPKTKETSLELQTTLVPTTDDVWTLRDGGQIYGPRLGVAVERATKARAFHWPLEFPDVMAAGGFDVVLGNPPWEVMQLSEEEYFAQHWPEVAELAGAVRKRAIADLQKTRPAIFAEFEIEKRRLDAGNEFTRASGRFDLTARGKVNTYSLFAELFTRINGPLGRAGIIVPTGIATDATTAAFFASLVDQKRLVQLISFENEEFIFPSVHHSFKFCLLTTGSQVSDTDFAFFLRSAEQLQDKERRFSLSSAQIALINPNTKTAPAFRSQHDAELTAKIYLRVPVFIEEADDEAGNPWGVEFRQGLFNMTSDSGLFRTAEQLSEAGYEREGTDWTLPVSQPTLLETAQSGHLGVYDGVAAPRERYVPLYEAKMIHYYDHRFGSYGDRGDERGFRVLPSTTLEQYKDPNYEPVSYYFVSREDVVEQLGTHSSDRWLVAFKDVTSAISERTAIFSLIPRVGVGHSAPLLFASGSYVEGVALLANLCTLVVDFCARSKVGGLHLTFFLLKQLPVLPPKTYGKDELEFVRRRVLELTYTSHSMSGFARDLGFDGPPFAWDEDRRAVLRAELDAWYARAYGLTRDELRYILDPADVMGDAYPSETFRVLKNSEMKKFREYRTRRLVLEAWDRLAQIEAPEATPVTFPAYTVPSTLPDGDWAMPAYNSVLVQLQLAAILKKLPGPSRADKVRLTAVYALHPSFLTPHLSGTERHNWQRLVGDSARVSDAENMINFIPRVNVEWRDAYTQLRGMHALLEDTENDTWAPGFAVQDFLTEGWPDGRAGFVLKALEGMEIERSIAVLPTEVQAWVKGYAA